MGYSGSREKHYFVKKITNVFLKDFYQGKFSYFHNYFLNKTHVEVTCIKFFASLLLTSSISTFPGTGYNKLLKVKI
jgi:hypothetical protein